MNIPAKMAQLDTWNVKVHIMRSEPLYSGHKASPWHVDLEKNDGEAAIKVVLFGATFEDTFERAVDRLESLAFEGLPLKALPAPAEPIDNEIPF